MDPLELGSGGFLFEDCRHSPPIIPAQAGTHLEISGWAPAFVGVTIE